jgi:hypothetical protein
MSVPGFPRHLLVSACLLLAIAGHAQTQAKCKFTTFSPPSGYYLAGVSGIDIHGIIVGELETTDTLQTVAFTRSASGVYTTYTAPNSSATYFAKRNDSGVTVGFFQDTNDNSHIHGLVRHGGSSAVVNYPGAPSTWLNGINNLGTIVGSYTASSASVNGFELQNGAYTVLQFPGALGTTPYGISDNNVVVGAWNDAFNYHGFTLENGQYQTLDHPQGTLGTVLEDVNKSGVIVGNYEAGDDFFVAFLYKNGGFENVVYPGSRNTVVGAINNNGVIAGQIYFENANSLGYTAVCQ